MIVKTGLQDATKNVRIYGTISAASSPSARPFHRRRRRRRASRIALPCPFSSPLPRPFLTPRPDLLLYVPLPPPSFRETHVGSYFLSSARRCAPPCTPFPPLHVLFRHPHLIAPAPVGRGAPPHSERAQRGAIAPTAAGTTLMLH